MDTPSPNRSTEPAAFLFLDLLPNPVREQVCLYLLGSGNRPVAAALARANRGWNGICQPILRAAHASLSAGWGLFYDGRSYAINREILWSVFPCRAREKLEVLMRQQARVVKEFPKPEASAYEWELERPPVSELAEAVRRIAGDEVLRYYSSYRSRGEVIG